MKPEVREFIANNQALFELLRKNHRSTEITAEISRKLDISLPTVYKYLNKAKDYKLIAKPKNSSKPYIVDFGNFATIYITASTVEVGIFDSNLNEIQYLNMEREKSPYVFVGQLLDIFSMVSKRTKIEFCTVMVPETIIGDGINTLIGLGEDRAPYKVFTSPPIIPFDVTFIRYTDAKAVYIGKFKKSSKNFVYLNTKLSQFSVVNKGKLIKSNQNLYYGTLPNCEEAKILNNFLSIEDDNEAHSFYLSNRETIYNYLKYIISSIFIFLNNDLYVDNYRRFIREHELDFCCFAPMAYYKTVREISVTDRELLKAATLYGMYYFFDWKLNL